MINLQQQAIEYANTIYIIPFKQAYGKIFREIREKANSLPKKKTIIYIDFLQERIDVLYEEHKLVCQNSSTCPHDIHYQNLFNGISEIKKEQVERMPWYKKTWVIFTTLAAIVAFIASIIIATNNGFSLMDRFFTKEPVMKEYIEESKEAVKDLIIKPSEIEANEKTIPPSQGQTDKSDSSVSLKDKAPEDRDDFKFRQKISKDLESIDKKLEGLWFANTSKITKKEYRGSIGGNVYTTGFTTERARKVRIRHELYEDIRYENSYSVEYRNHNYILSFGDEKMLTLSILKELDKVDYNKIGQIFDKKFQEEIQRFVK